MQHAGNNNEVPHKVVCRAINFKLRQLPFVHLQAYGDKDFRGCSAAPDAAWCLLRGKSRAKLRHHRALRTGEEALRSTRVLHQCIVVPEKPLFLKREGLTFCFNTNWQVWDSHQNKSLQHSSKCCFLSGPPWSLHCYLSDRHWACRRGWGRTRNTYSNDVFISQQLYNKKLSSAESTSVQTVAENKSRCKHLHGFPLQTCFAFLCLLHFQYKSTLTAHKIR